MPPDVDDAARLWDMLTYAREVITTAGAVSFDAYMADKTLRLATERRIEIIGEAARHVSTGFQEAHPEIPWQKVAAQRHVIAHEYGDIKHELIFRVVQVHVPQLIPLLEPLVPPPPSSE